MDRGAYDRHITSIEVIDMIREAPAMTVRQNLGELLNEIQYRGDSVVITKSGKPVAALIDIELFERLRTLDEQYEHFRGELAQVFSNVPTDEGIAVIDEAVRAARGQG
jgi:prevent-host-death family protein